MTPSVLIMVSDLGASRTGPYAAQRRSAALVAEYTAAFGRVIVAESAAALEKALAADPAAVIAIEGADAFAIARGIVSDNASLIYDSRGPGSAAAETELLERARLVVAATAHEAERLRELTDAPVVVFREAITPTTASDRSRRAAQQLLASRQLASFAAVVGGSAEAGAAELLGLLTTRLGYLGADQSVLLADDLAAAVGDRLQASDPFYGAAFWSRAFTTDPYRAELFAPLLELATVLVLQGGDAGRARLSVPEAILSGTPVLLTAEAAEGHDDLVALSSVVVGPATTDFGPELARLIAAPPVADAAELARLRNSYAVSEGRQELAMALGQL